MIKVVGLNKHFGRLHVLRDVNFEVAKGEVVVILGRSGSGKSTLLRCLNYLEPPDSGEIWIDGQRVDPRRTNLQALREEMGFVFQHFNLFPHLTALDNVTLALRVVKKMPEAHAREIGMGTLGKVGLAAKADAYPDQLSGGQQQRVAIARSMAMNPKVMLFDEPTSALDPELIGEVLAAMEDLARAGMTMIVVTHEMGFARRVAQRALFMHEGCFIEAGTPAELFENPKTPEARTFISSIL
ncbi:MAG: amino acid ABC transporter ATP-binding protein [Bacillota bacterium]|nr:amino acid ABC transporter ATP-binding protein [Bacillota bacterium]